MKRPMPKLWQQATAASMAVLVTVLLPVSAVFADTKPYFQTAYGGPFAGGAFKDAGSCSANYQTPYGPSGAPDYYKGAIMAFGTVSAPTTRGGAHSGLDAFALGKIEGNAANQYGFYSGLSNKGPLSFSNINTSPTTISDFWGGNLEGQASDAHCIPDYFGTKSDSATEPVRNSGPIAGMTIAAGDKKIIFVNGNAYISGDIKYEPHDADSIPKFALVVKGNIYIGPNVNQLDGWYIAQPSGANDGEIWTCHDNSTDLPKDTWMRDNCNSSLTINGALTAAQVNLGRINGNISSNSPAETVNFTPDMVLGGAFFNDTSASKGATGAIQSLVNLPPIF